MLDLCGNCNIVAWEEWDAHGMPDEEGLEDDLRCGPKVPLSHARAPHPLYLSYLSLAACVRRRTFSFLRHGAPLTPFTTPPFSCSSPSMPSALMPPPRRGMNGSNAKRASCTSAPHAPRTPWLSTRNIAIFNPEC